MFSPTFVCSCHVTPLFGPGTKKYEFWNSIREISLVHYLVYKVTWGGQYIKEFSKEFTTGLIVPKSFPHSKERRANMRLYDAPYDTPTANKITQIFFGKVRDF